MSIQNLFSNARLNKASFRILLARIIQFIFILIFLISTVGVKPASAEDPIPSDRVPLNSIGTPASAPMQQDPEVTYLQRALVLVNSQSVDFLDFRNFIQPYLDHFGVPYTTLNISTTEVTASVGESSVIIVGHRNLDSGTSRYLTTEEEGFISAAINGGTGLVNFDNALSADESTGRYTFVNDIFGFSYNSDTSGSGVLFADPSTHYITERHSGGSSISTGTMTLPGIASLGHAIALATTDTQPLLAVTGYGTGHAVQFGSYDWISISVKGPMYGLDDLVWRSIVWAARKPFVMRGMPPFLTLRVDDEVGPLTWLQIATEPGIDLKPWAGIFISAMSEADANSLATFANAGKATVAIHAFNGSPNPADDVNFYPWQTDEQIAANYLAGTAWFTTHNIPISKYVLPHNYQFGSNSFHGMNDWGVEFVGTIIAPDQPEMGSSWLNLGPFRKWETSLGQYGVPFTYADFMTIPNHADLDGEFFNCMTEIRDENGYEWYPNMGNVSASIGHGVAQVLRAWDAMTMGVLFTHGEYIDAQVAASPDNWRAILQGVLSGLADYNPEIVTTDYACQYMRATVTSTLTGGSYNPATREITANFTGNTDTDIKYYAFLEDGEQVAVNVPAFTGGTTASATLPLPSSFFDHLVLTPSNSSITVGGSETYSVEGFDSEGTSLGQVTDAVLTIAPDGSCTAYTCTVTGAGAHTVTASKGSAYGSATLNVTAGAFSSLALAPGIAWIASGGEQTYTVEGFDSYGNSLGQITDAVLTITPDGSCTGYTCTATETGSHTVTATKDSTTGTSNLIVGVTPSDNTYTLWNESRGEPVYTCVHSGSYGGSVELGVKFKAANDGVIRGIRFARGDGGTHLVHLWSTDGTMLAEASITGGGSWQSGMFSVPVPITKGTVYVASYHNDGGFGYSPQALLSGWDGGPLHALGTDEAPAGNGVYKLGAGAVFPDQSDASNYWVDVIYSPYPDSSAPGVFSMQPASAATNVPVTTVITATFTEPVDMATLQGNFTLQGPGGVVSATVTNWGWTATLHTVTTLAYSTTYTLMLKGGSAGVKDTAGNPLPADYTWTFTTAAPASVPADSGPGGPILVIGSTLNPFGRYLGEILGTEGLNEFTLTDISTVDAIKLAGYDVVVLGEMPLTAAQTTMFSDWVDSGGKLIAMRPDKKLAGLLGLTDASATLSNAYLKVDTSTGPGVGIVSDTMQFHGTADKYTTTGASIIARLYSDATTTTANPAVTLRSVGTSGGQAAAFTYDLARSVVYTHQGNPQWANQMRTIEWDYSITGQAETMFYGPASYDPQPNWVDVDKMQIPQADEQQRLLANLITKMEEDNLPIPRFWYLPHDYKGAVLLTGDTHGGGSASTNFNYDLSVSPAGCSVDDWQCVRASTYDMTEGGMSEATAIYFTNQGFEVALHVDTNDKDYTPSEIQALYSTQLAIFHQKYPNMQPPTTERTHGVVWSDWVSQAKVEVSNGIRLDTNYYHGGADLNDPQGLWNRPGLFTGSGIPMRFADSDGTIIDNYQANSQLTDQQFCSPPCVQAGWLDTLLDNAVGPSGFYAVITANMHNDIGMHPGMLTIISHAQARGVPIVSGRQVVTWLDARNASAFRSLIWNSNKLTFSIDANTAAVGLRAMLPTSSPAGLDTLATLRHEGVGVSFSLKTIKGIEYAVFDAEPGNYTATYEPDETPPVISAVQAAPGPNSTAVITWTTDEDANSRVDYGTSPNTLDQTQSNATETLSHSLTLTGLAPDTAYYYRVTSTDIAPTPNTATFPVLTDPPLSFVTPSGSFTDTTAADFIAGSGSGTYVAHADDGEVLLSPAVGAEFDGSSLPGDWSVWQWAVNENGSASVSDGKLTVDGARAGTTATFGPGRSLEFMATFNVGVGTCPGSTSPCNTAGFGTTWEALPWAMFEVYNGALHARSQATAGTAFDTVLSSSWLGAPHFYRIDWSSDNVKFYIDGNLVVTFVVAITANMRPMVGQAGAGTFSVDWMHVSPYPSPATFTSRIFDATRAASWGPITWTAALPDTAGAAVSVRSGNTSSPDGTWSIFAPITQGEYLTSRGRYVQYSVALTTGNDRVTPQFQDITLNFTLLPTGPADHLVFAVQPVGTIAGATISPPVTVRILDLNGNLVTSNADVALSPSSGTLHGTITVQVVGGVATFSDLSISETGTYTLTAASDGLTGATSNSFDITPAPVADHLAFGVQPANTRVGTPISPPVTVRILDNHGDLFSSNANVTLSPNSGTLHGTTTVQAVGGVATFGDLYISETGTYTLNATSDGLTGVTSNSFDVALLPFLDTTVADFSAGSGTGTYVAQTADGEVTLQPTMAAEFNGSSLPGDWSFWQWGGTDYQNGSASVANGTLTVDGAKAGTTATFDAGRSLEFATTFSAGTGTPCGGSSSPCELAGFGTTWEALPWAFFEVYNGGLHVRSAPLAPGTPMDTLLSNSYLDSPHRFRVDWGSSSVTFYIDGELVATHVVSISAAMRPMVGQGGAGTFSVDCMRMSPYPSSGTFSSRIFDAGGPANWGTLAATLETPTATSVQLQVRFGNTTTPDGSWTSFMNIANGAQVGGNSRYIQYQALLATTNPNVTPVVDDVNIIFTPGADTVAPTVSAVFPASGAYDAASNTAVTAAFSEPMASATINSSTFTLVKQGNSTPIAATVTYNASTKSATLQPNAALDLGSTYVATLSIAVTDMAGNSLQTNYTWTFGVAGHYTDTTVADFSAGTTGTTTYVSQMTDGEIILQPTVGTEFSGNSLPLDWSEWHYSDFVKATVANGTLTVDGARVGPTATFSPGHALDFVATYQGIANSAELVGFGTTWEAVPWAIVDTTYPTNTGMRVRSNYSSQVITTVAGNWLGAPHHYRIEWNSGDVKYYFDGTLVATHAWSGTTQMRPMVAETAGPAALTVDWMHMSPYASTGTFTSRVIDAGQPVHWLALTSTTTGTSVSFETRTGSVATPDASWSNWQAVSNPIASPDGRYIQYRASLSTSDLNQTPTIESVNLTYNTNVYSPTISGNAGVDGATLSYTDGTPKTVTADGSGNYSITVPYGWSGTVTPSKTGYTFTPDSKDYTDVTANQTAQDFSATLITCTISGTVLVGGNGLAGVSVSDGTHTDTTATDGSYTIANVPPGTYTLTPTLAGYTFSPATLPAVVSSANLTEKNFTATLITYSISGTVLVGGNGLAGVSVSDGTRTDTTATDGSYTIANVPPGTYTLTPTVAGYTFSPATLPAVVSSANLTGKDFSATLITYSISGTVLVGGNGLAGVTVSDGTRTDTTDADGNYTIANVPPGTYTMTPTLTGYTFSPATLPAVVTSANLTGKDFSATLITYTISGTVTSGGSGLAGVSVSDGTRTDTTDADGNYTITNVPPGSYTLTPTLAGYTFSPATFPAVVTSTNLTGKDFSATFIQNVHSISLTTGWNLVSFNLHPVNTDIANVLSSLVGNYDLVYAWDATGAHSTSGNWMKYAPTAPPYSNSLTNLDEKMGFWIHMTSADTLDVVGSVPVTTNIALSDNAGGWNLVAYPSAENGDLPAVLVEHGVGTDFSIVYAYHANDTADPWKLFGRTVPIWANDLTELAPGWGYWIKVTADNTWDVEYGTP
jgi:hypothetical protein